MREIEAQRKCQLFTFCLVYSGGSASSGLSQFYLRVTYFLQNTYLIWWRAKEVRSRAQPGIAHCAKKHYGH